MTTYQATSTIPPLVQQATALAAEFGFTSSCTPEVGRLLDELKLLVLQLTRLAYDEGRAGA